MNPPPMLHDESAGHEAGAPLAPALLSARGDVPHECALLARMAAGDQGALGELYSLYSDALYSYALRITGGESDAEEVLQDAFVKFWRRARGFDPAKSRPFTWAVMITRSLAIDRVRRLDVRRRTFAAVEREPDHFEPANSGDAVREVLFAETVERVRRAMSRLSENERRCVEAAVFDCAGSSEIATLLDVPTGTAKSWLHRGLTKLRHWLNHEPE